MAAFSSSDSRLKQTAPPFFPQALLPAPTVATRWCIQPHQLHMPPAYGWCPVACGCYLCRSAGFLSVSGVWTCAFPPPPPPLQWHPGYYNFPAPPPLPLLWHPGYYNFPAPPPPQPPTCVITDLSSEEELSPRSVLTVRNSKELSNSPPSPVRRRAALPRRLRQLPAADGAKKARPSAPRCPRLAFNPTADVTSLMIRNIPNSFTKRRFIAILDQHCADENAKLGGDGDGDGVKSEYDFLYVPIDFGTKSNKGYAFVNMTTAAAARRLHAHLDGHRWAVGRRRKVCDVVHARVEGLDGLVEHFFGSRFPCYGEQEFLPVRFDPPRDGVRETAEHVVGRLQHRPS